MLKKLFAKLTGSGKKSKPAKKRTVKKAARKKPASKKPAAASKKKKARAAPSDSDKPIGEVVAFFRIPVVAVIKLTQGSLKVGDTIWIYGHTTNIKQTIASMQINHKPVAQIRKGAEAGIKIPSRARRGDRIYLLPG